MKVKPDPPPARRSRTPYVLLGMLLPGPANGYELKRRIETSVGHFWQESFGQLYPALALLERQGLVRQVAQEGARAKARRFAITPAGRKALASWVMTPPTPQPERNELLLKVFFAQVHPDAVNAHVLAAAQQARLYGAQLGALREQMMAGLDGQPGLPAWLATLDYGAAAMDALAAWCERTQKALKDLPRQRL
jgi:PadR family transcriptional regulator AphA